MSFKQKNRVSVLLEMLSQYLATFINTDIFRTQSNIYDEQKWVTVNPLTVCYFRAKSFIIDVWQDLEYALRVHFYLFCEHFEFRIPNLSETLFYRYPEAYIRFYQTETTLQMSSQEKVFWKYAANLQENIHDKVWFQ